MTTTPLPPHRGTAPLARRPPAKTPTRRVETGPLTSPSPAEASELLALGTWAAAWQVAWPLVVTTALSVGNGLVDTWIAGDIGPVAQATVGLTLQVVLMINAIMAAVGMGCQVFVARHVGAGDWYRAARAAQQSIMCAVALSLVVLVPVVTLAPAFYAAMGASPAVIHEGSTYLRLLMLGLIPMNLGVLLTSVFKARGKTIAKLLPTCVESAVWLAGSLALGWGLGWGLPGLALAFVLGKVAGGWMAWRAFRRSALGRQVRGPWRPDLACMSRMLRVGAPTGLQNVLRNLARMAVYAILAFAALPADAMAAYAIGFRLESAVYLPLMALGIAAATLVGQHLGAGRPERAAEAGRAIAFMAVGAATLAGVALWLAADPIASAFTVDPLVWAWTVDLLRALAAGLPFLAVGTVLSGALQGAGETEPPMLFTLGSQLGVGIPLAYALSWSWGWGPTGVWWAITAGTVVQAALVTWWYVRGSWRRRAI